MAETGLVELLKRNVEAWNELRLGDQVIDLTDADLEGAKIGGANLSNLNLAGARLVKANLENVNFEGSNLEKSVVVDSHLKGANFDSANLTRADLSFSYLEDAHFCAADLIGTDFSWANLKGARICAADLTGAIFYGAGLERTNFSQSNLNSVDFSRADMRRTCLIEAKLAFTKFTDVDLSTVVGLMSVIHEFASSIALDTLQKSGPLPAEFLLGCGVPPAWTENVNRIANPSSKTFYTPLISYSSADSEAADQLEQFLTFQNGIPCWRDTEQLFPGEEPLEAIRKAVEQADRLLVLCSKSSLSTKKRGWWVDQEIELGLNKERRKREDGSVSPLVVIPIDLDGYLYSNLCTSRHRQVLRDRVEGRLSVPKQLNRILEALRVGGPQRPLNPPPKGK